MPRPTSLRGLRRLAGDHVDRSRQLGVVAPAPVPGSRSLDALERPNRGLMTRIPFGKIVGYILMTLLAAVMAIPLYWMLSGAFKEYAEIRAIPPVWVPDAWRNAFSPDALGFGNFVEAWNAAPFGRFYLNTLIITAAGTAGELFNACLTAYAFAFLRFPKKDLIFVLLLVALMIPGEVTTLPNYIFIGSTIREISSSLLGFEITGINTYWGIFLPAVSTAYGTFLLRQAFLSLPREVLEAARLEGASHIRLLWDMVIPMSKPILITYGLISAVAHWNAYLWPLVVTRTIEMRPLTVGISYLFDTEGNTNYGVVMAATCFVVLPLILVYIWAQRFIIDGIAAGATKG
ncbi:MAG: N-acetyl-D-glucosamine ABC transporter, permease protein 2 [uncultured Thermomicrobiales bacterium]|uniref:N-acetyl-D-glucosamine ABC transporter, permease protein 2 n=1 Tax=uncultured Thermomicrobiales bacterium TaxID=1645740 RepID=A0A6J4UN32_9BACT|nr:MAG: N-acetyl-D-glucosamine ABC transporter, permease protein 2 [uncultured Thermomicrobiales bacterium]